MNENDAGKLTAAFVDWFDRQPSCLALAVTGSWSRDATRQAPRLELVVLTDDAEGWMADAGWLRIVLQAAGYMPTPPVREDRGAVATWRTRPSYRAEVDVSFAPPAWAAVEPVDDAALGMASGGIRVLRDPHGMLAPLAAAVAARTAAQGEGDAGEDGTGTP